MQQIKLHAYAMVLCQTKRFKSGNAEGKYNYIQNLFTFINRDILIEIKYAFSKQLKMYAYVLLNSYTSLHWKILKQAVIRLCLP